MTSKEDEINKENALWEVLDGILSKNEDRNMQDILILLGPEAVDRFNEEDLIKALSGLDDQAYDRVRNRKQLVKEMLKHKRYLEQTTTAGKMNNKKAVFRRK